ncbi:conserved hypothetical protein [Candidatus Sulfopaludibacter sp. SbA4]|nr:conserved hypothetical protein [Candidatus Sulfopaludibacter sp. SbA4]
MRKLEWHNLPRAVRHHLYLRGIERGLSADDLARLERWKRSQPNVPDGPWYKDFGSFKLCGEGPYPKTFLLRGQAARGQAIE